MRATLNSVLLFILLLAFTTDGWVQTRSDHHFLKDSSYELYTEILNPSFEETFFRNADSTQYYLADTIVNWMQFEFPRQSPVTIQVNGYQGFSSKTEAYDGEIHLNMVTRSNETYEVIAQKLTNSLRPGETYYFGIKACLSTEMMSPALINGKATEYPISFCRPVNLKVLGAKDIEKDLYPLAFTPPVRSIEWKEYLIKFTPTERVDYLIIRSAFDPLSKEPYCGNVSIDYLSDIYYKP